MWNGAHFLAEFFHFINSTGVTSDHDTVICHCLRFDQTFRYVDDGNIQYSLTIKYLLMPIAKHVLTQQIQVLTQFIWLHTVCVDDVLASTSRGYMYFKYTNTALFIELDCMNATSKSVCNTGKMDSTQTKKIFLLLWIELNAFSFVFFNLNMNRLTSEYKEEFLLSSFFESFVNCRY